MGRLAILDGAGQPWEKVESVLSREGVRVSVTVDVYRGTGAGAKSEILCGDFAICATTEVMRQFAKDLLQFFTVDTDPVASIVLDADIEEASSEDDYDGLPETDGE